MVENAEQFQFPRNKTRRSQDEIDAAETQIIAQIKDVRYIIREYPVEVVVEKYLNGIETDENEIYVPDYQRDLIWPSRHQSRFIESLLIGIPIPFLFLADVNDNDDPGKAGRLEIVDGVQRIRTLAEFMTGSLELNALSRLSKLNGFRFCDLHPSRQRRFRRATLRLIELTEAVGEDVRREMFDRINSGSVKLEAVEIRRGMEPGPFLDLVTDLAADPLLRELAPISEDLRKRFEYEELVTRFFAFLNRYESFGKGKEGKVVAAFLLKFVQDKNEELNGPDHQKLVAEMKRQWTLVLCFVKDHFPDGFRKKSSGRKVPRVRFEAIAVGTGLAVRDLENRGLDVSSLKTSDIATWLAGEEFRVLTTSDAANNRSNLVGRLEYVRNKLLGR
ncbi:MAG: DUF262 domain-containing protein [Alphaproteobacteria bacterium]|nr:DUF262 domain-containing protein [Alphaproteobacteria bacterium]